MFTVDQVFAAVELPRPTRSDVICRAMLADADIALYQPADRAA